MRTVRRIYFYAVTFVSLEVVVWALIGLGRSAFDGQRVGGEVRELAGALAFILVGLPIFLVHWRLIQREALRAPEERWTVVRAVFLYGAQLALLLPVVQNILAIVDRAALRLFDLAPDYALLGVGQSWVDNLMAVVMNVGLAGYIGFVSRSDWDAKPQGEAFGVVRRATRYLWVLYALGLTVFGVKQILQYLLSFTTTTALGGEVILANGLALTLTGAPLWAWCWGRVQSALESPDERTSTLRLGVLYALVFVSVGVVSVSSGAVLSQTLRSLLVGSITFAGFFGRISGAVSTALPFGVVWLYYGGVLRRDVDALPDTPQRGGMRRLYYYVLALLGLGASFIGAQMLIAYLLDVTLGAGTLVGEALTMRLADALATLAVGLPLWAWTWRPVTREAVAEGERGDHARRSLVRKAYLYLVLFAGMMGVMFSCGALLFQLIRVLLGDLADEPLLTSLQTLQTLVLFGGVLAYHWGILRGDSRQATMSLAARHAQFPVLVLQPEAEEFAEHIVPLIQDQTPELPLVVHPVVDGAPDENQSAARAVILPAYLAANPPEALRVWLRGYAGERVVVPVATQGWMWLGVGEEALGAWGKRAAKVLSKLAEGEGAESMQPTSAWTVVGYVLAGLVGLGLLCSLSVLLEDVF